MSSAAVAAACIAGHRMQRPPSQARPNPRLLTTPANQAPGRQVLMSGLSATSSVRSPVAAFHRGRTSYWRGPKPGDGRKNGLWRSRRAGGGRAGVRGQACRTWLAISPIWNPPASGTPCHQGRAGGRLPAGCSALRNRSKEARGPPSLPSMDTATTTCRGGWLSRRISWWLKAKRAAVCCWCRAAHRRHPPTAPASPCLLVLLVHVEAILAPAVAQHAKHGQLQGAGQAVRLAARSLAASTQDSAAHPPLLLQPRRPPCRAAPTHWSGSTRSPSSTQLALAVSAWRDTLSTGVEQSSKPRPGGGEEEGGVWLFCTCCRLWRGWYAAHSGALAWPACFQPASSSSSSQTRKQQTHQGTRWARAWPTARCTRTRHQRCTRCSGARPQRPPAGCRTSEARRRRPSWQGTAPSAPVG